MAGKYEVNVMSISEQTTQQAFETIKQTMIDDKPSEEGSYAHSWHCNVAMSCYDAIMREQDSRCTLAHGMAHRIANDAASRFMKLCFGVETKA